MMCFSILSSIRAFFNCTKPKVVDKWRSRDMGDRVKLKALYSSHDVTKGKVYPGYIYGTRFLFFGDTEGLRHNICGQFEEESNA